MRKLPSYLMVLSFIVSIVFIYQCLTPEGLPFHSPSTVKRFEKEDNTATTDRPKIFMIEERDFCRRNPDLFIIAYVHTTINETQKRQLTRETWAKAGHFDEKVKVGVVFMVGWAKTSEEEKILAEESALHRDMVQADYADSYHTLSYKALASLEWVSRHCSHVPWTLHADDDVLIDLFRLTNFLKTVHGLDRKKFLCHTWPSSNVRRGGRWHVSPNEFPGKQYPPYCSGAVWLLATRFIQNLLNASHHTIFLWVDDVYITGVLAEVAGIGHFNHININKGKIDNSEIGKKVAWVHIADRYQWWQKILSYHQHV